MDKIKQLTGKLKLDFYEKGHFTHSTEDYNLIVDSGYQAILHGLYGLTGKNIVKAQCGTNQTAPTPADVTITDATDLTISNFSVVGKSLVIKFTLGASDANGDIISEFGLICADGSLFSRKSWTPFLKISDLSIEGTWTINI